jgi:glycosyltransferase involved in cell wall biosynthesis
MNVLFVTIVDLSGRSGQNIYGLEIARALGKDPSVNLLLTCPAPAEATLSQLGVDADDVWFLSKKRDRQISWHIMAQVRILQAIRKLATTHKIELIIAPLKPSMVMPALAACFWKIPYVVIAEGLMIQRLKSINPFLGSSWLARLVVRLNMRVARKVFAAYEEARQWLQTFRTPQQTDVELFYAAVDPDLFQPMSALESRQAIAASISKDDFVVGFVGSFKAYHSLTALLEAVSRLGTEILHLKVLLVGEGPEYRVIHKLAKTKGLESKVIFAGFVPHSEIPRHISACNIMYGVIAPAHNENPMKCYEYLACDKPIIARQTSDLAFVDRNSFGVLVNSDEPGEIAQAIRTLFKAEKRRNEMDMTAREYILAHHTWGQLVERILATVR